MRRVLLLLTLSACGQGSALLVVDLRTDLVPTVEFASADVVLLAAGEPAGVLITRDVEADEDFVEGERLAEYDGLRPGAYRAEVRLRNAAGAIVAERFTRLDIDAGTLAITVLITRDCRGVTCPGDGDDPSQTQCHAGRCVPEECSEENPEACGDAECTVDGDCVFAAACALARCSSGVCLADSMTDACAADEFCDPDSGCEQVGNCMPGEACDPGEICATGVTDCSTGVAVCRTVGPASAGKPCRLAVDSCDAAETCDGASTVCPPDVLALVGTPCDEGFCNGFGECGVCTEGDPCPTLNACEIGEVDCSTGSPVCMGVGSREGGTVCRAAVGDCDVAELCDGTRIDCPADVFADPGELCRESMGACDVADTCTGSDPGCPIDSVAIAGVECRPAAGECDVAELCDGVGLGCPVDRLEDSGVVCRATAEACDEAERCSGTEAVCPEDEPLIPGCEVAYREAGNFDYTVPVGCEVLRVTTWGAGGGQGLGNTRAGAGGFADAGFDVSPGEELNVWVGGPGENATSVGGVGGAPGGGRGGNGSSSQGGGGGGGYSGVFRGPTDPANALVLAGGGGGSGGGTSTAAGAGGGLDGQDGTGEGGSQVDGGMCVGSGCTDGLALEGGDGGNQATGDGGGGGGGGWFGGGGAGGANSDAFGGGGGSGYVSLLSVGPAPILEAGNRNVPGGEAVSARMGAAEPEEPGAVRLRCVSE